MYTLRTRICTKSLDEMENTLYEDTKICDIEFGLSRADILPALIPEYSLLSRTDIKMGVSRHATLQADYEYRMMLISEAVYY
jgi:hypothetical protein